MTKTAVIDAPPASATPLDRILAAVAGHREVALTISHYAAAATRNMSQMPDSIRIIGALSWSNEWWHPERDTLQALIRNDQPLVRHGISR